MKTLILTGSPRKNGDSNSLLRKFLLLVKGEYCIVDAYTTSIAPCVDCRY